MPKSITILFFVGILSLGAILYFAFTANATRVEELTFLGEDLRVWTARDALEKKNGLSFVDLDELEKARVEGMLFVFPEKDERVFWMKGMKFDLDFVWIRDGQIVKIDRNIKAPKEGEQPARIFSEPFKVDMVLELPSGGIDRFGMHPGQTIGPLKMLD